MGFSKRIAYFMVHSLGFSNKEALELIQALKVEVNGKTISENCLLEDHFEIKVKGKIVRPAKTLIYLKFHKPRGLVSSLNKNVPDNISAFFKDYEGLSIAGRLDKASEGLLLLSNNGKWVDRICSPGSKKEKEYEVVLDREPAPDFFTFFQAGLHVGKYATRPCQCEPIAKTRIKVILTEGKNRQIRRMCEVLGYSVIKLKRIRIDNYHLGNLTECEIRSFAID